MDCLQSLTHLDNVFKETLLDIDSNDFALQDQITAFYVICCNFIINEWINYFFFTLFLVLTYLPLSIILTYKFVDME